ncbi:monosaccharide ABC transporter ATP-binding protein, CUT2 family [Faunimonas pinastri]|uniref:Monosaccharide ABC transporter ATP-binding protein, CUT2 family n=1 Tax=Faunimonas pinastri TaxID=1855383 RepID=A0A1H9KXD1_9HYPH|nr:sugar ABC transporter ATP-binding protein [Faunimonas pinastri]SER03527.1 monosaccharide ABC transporter ATP-binding protein, CUT2 family [Faunimonas pinastri]
MTGAPALLASERVSRSFGPVQVLFDVDFDLVPGEVHALIGENGAGKSTLMKILSGAQPPSAGTLRLDGGPMRFSSTEEAEDRGIVLIHQELNLADQLTVEANIFLGRELKRGPFLDVRAMRREAHRLLAELETGIDPASRVSDLSVSDKQMVEIAKALSRRARVLIMDEPTAVLTARESQSLFRQIARLRAQGVAILYTSHKLDEVKAISDRVTVLRDGRIVQTTPTAAIDEDGMARAMVGRDLNDLFPDKAPSPEAEIVLEVRGLDVPGHVRGASFTLRRGEVLGLAGLVGSGRTELMEGLMGLRPSTGWIRLRGQTVRIHSPGQAAKLGLAYLTEDRKGRGLLLDKTMRPNLTLLGLDRFSNIFINKRAEERALDDAIARFDIRARRRDVRVGNLSGGNQQKLLLAKTMLVEPEIVIVDEPTRGIDIGTKQQIYGFIEKLAAEGKSVIVISSEMAEVIGLCHRVLVMRSGRITGELTGDAIAEHQIVRHAMGLEGSEIHDRQH